MNYITRSIEVTKVNATKVTIKDGKTVTDKMENLTLIGKFNKKEAQVYLSAKLDNNSAIIISDVSISTRQYRISIEKFIECAEDITPTASGKNKKE